MNNKIKRCMKKAKENWIGEQCSETEENLRKNNSKRAYQLVDDLTTVKKGCFYFLEQLKTKLRMQAKS